MPLQERENSNTQASEISSAEHNNSGDLVDAPVAFSGTPRRMLTARKRCLNFESVQALDGGSLDVNATNKSTNTVRRFNISIAPLRSEVSTASSTEQNNHGVSATSLSSNEKKSKKRKRSSSFNLSLATDSDEEEIDIFQDLNKISDEDLEKEGGNERKRRRKSSYDLRPDFYYKGKKDYGSSSDEENPAGNLNNLKIGQGLKKDKSK